MPHRFAFAFICFLLAGLPAARGEDPLENARKVISSQIDAIVASDARTAYSFASPGIRSLFPDESRFIDMVKKRYEPLSRAGRYAFGRSKLVGGGEMVLQEVIISGRDAKDWTAIYEMRLQDDGSYKVNGVRMLEKTTSTGI